MTNAIAYREKFITVNNVRLRHLDYGANGKTPLICMHGHAGQAHIWDEFAEAASPYYHVLVMDQRGHGDSGWAVDGYARDRFVEDLDAFIKSLGLGKVVLAGLSMGGWNAMLYAAANPSAVERIVIVDIAPERSDEALRDQVTRPPTPMAFYNFEEAFAWARAGNPWATETRSSQGRCQQDEAAIHGNVGLEGGPGPFQQYPAGQPGAGVHCQVLAQFRSHRMSNHGSAGQGEHSGL